MEGEVTDDECLKAIRSLKTGKAVGDDKVANEMLKEGGGGGGIVEGNNIHHGSHTTTRVDTRSMAGGAGHATT